MKKCQLRACWGPEATRLRTVVASDGKRNRILVTFVGTGHSIDDDSTPLSSAAKSGNVMYGPVVVLGGGRIEWE